MAFSTGGASEIGSLLISVHPEVVQNDVANDVVVVESVSVAGH